MLQYQRDGVWKDVDSGYPKVDSFYHNLIIVRFPRFNSKLFYDPTVSVESEDDVTDDNNGNGGGKGGISDSNCLSVSAMFVTMTTALTYILLK